ncbi:MAG: hypothetical protein KGL39_34995 [Patescibacteria group bacterium]|nr:hypothetical protein [Patescibacteria group bacterium]
MSTIAFNPAITTTAAGTFNVSSSGFIAGTAYPDPASRNYLSGGVLASTETLPMWGGVGVSENMVTPGSLTLPERALGSSIIRATTLTAAAAGQLVGFSVFDQAHAWINTPQSPVPQTGSGGLVNYYRLGSLARIALPISTALSSLEGGVVTAQVSWEFVNQMIVPYTDGYSAATITGAVWASTSGGQTTYTVGTDLTTHLHAGDNINVTGVVNTGGASTSAYNGVWYVVSVSSTTIVVSAPAAASLGTYASGGSVNAVTGGVLPVKILDVDFGNSMVPVYNSSTGFVTWNRSGNAALCLI